MPSPETKAMLSQLQKSKSECLDRVHSLTGKLNSNTRDLPLEEDLQAIADAVCNLADALRAECELLRSMLP